MDPFNWAAAFLTCAAVVASLRSMVRLRVASVIGLSLPESAGQSSQWPQARPRTLAPLLLALDSGRFGHH